MIRTCVSNKQKQRENMAELENEDTQMEKQIQSGTDKIKATNVFTRITWQKNSTHLRVTVSAPPIRPSPHLPIPPSPTCLFIRLLMQKIKPAQLRRATGVPRTLRHTRPYADSNENIAQSCLNKRIPKLVLATVGVYRTRFHTFVPAEWMDLFLFTSTKYSLVNPLHHDHANCRLDHLTAHLSSLGRSIF